MGKIKNTVLTDWDAAKAGAFNTAPVIAHHNLHERAMFSDAGLADLLERYPRDKFNIYTMNNDPHPGRREFRLGSPGNLSGAEILTAIKTGRLWVNLREANRFLADYSALCDEMFGSLESVVPGLSTFKRDLGVLISSPRARVFYHLDIPLVTLWQLRGEKTMWVYPTGAPFARDREIEGIVLREREEEIYYDPAFDTEALKVVLKPGMMANWPQTAPHRIDNGNMVNVSLSVEFQTLGALVHANALYANGVLRRKYGRRPVIANEGAVSKHGKAVLARAFKALNFQKEFERKVQPTFIVDPTAENAVRELHAA